MKRYKMPIILVIALPFAFVIFWLVTTSRAATETPDYTLVSKDQKFEIRDYPNLTVATTSMGDGEVDRGFMQLFRFITGSNESAEKISMTSPVLIDYAKGRQTMSFIMPKKAVEKGVPKPVGEGVTLSKVEAARFAVLRFAGGRNSGKETAAIESLVAWVSGQELVTEGEPIFAFYDPPWTPDFLRRNEVLIRVAKTDDRPQPR